MKLSANGASSLMKPMLIGFAVVAPKTADKWHFDEVVIGIKGKKYYLWWSVDMLGQAIGIFR